MTRRRDMIAVSLGALTALAACSSEQQAPEPRPLDVDALQAKLDAGEDVFVLDVRRPEEIEEHGAIEGYVNIPVDELEARLAEVPRDRPVAVY